MVYTGIFASGFRAYVRAETIRDAARQFIFAFDAEPSLVEEKGPDYMASIGEPLAYDRAANSMGHPIPKEITKGATAEQLANVLAGISAA